MPAKPASTARSATASTSSSGEIGGDLHQHRAVGGGAHCGQDRRQRLDGLQIAQARRVGRADVDDDEVGRGRGLRRYGCSRLRPAPGRRPWSLPMLAPIGTEWFAVSGERRPNVRRPRRRRVVEPHPVHWGGAVGGQSEQTRLGVAGLGLAGDRPDLGVSESQRPPRACGRGALVESGGQAHRCGKVVPSTSWRKDRVVDDENTTGESAESGKRADQPDETRHQAVDRFGRDAEHQPQKRQGTWRRPRRRGCHVPAARTWTGIRGAVETGVGDAHRSQHLVRVTGGDQPVRRGVVRVVEDEQDHRSDPAAVDQERNRVELAAHGRALCARRDRSTPTDDRTGQAGATGSSSPSPPTRTRWRPIDTNRAAKTRATTGNAHQLQAARWAPSRIVAEDHGDDGRRPHHQRGTHSRSSYRRVWASLVTPLSVVCGCARSNRVTRPLRPAASQAPRQGPSAARPGPPRRRRRRPVLDDRCRSWLPAPPAGRDRDRSSTAARHRRSSSTRARDWPRARACRSSHAGHDRCGLSRRDQGLLDQSHDPDEPIVIKRAIGSRSWWCSASNCPTCVKSTSSMTLSRGPVDTGRAVDTRPSGRYRKD